MADEKKKYIYERNPDTGEVRRREFNDYTSKPVGLKSETVEPGLDHSSPPSETPDAPWVQHSSDAPWWKEEKQLLKEDKEEDDTEEDRQLSFPFQ